MLRMHGAGWWVALATGLVGTVGLLGLAAFTKEDTAQVLCGFAGLLLFPLFLSAVVSGFPAWWIVAYVACIGVAVRPR